MAWTETLAVRLAISLGIGLLIGAERERRKGVGPSRAPAGIRTFALVALAGGVSLAFGGEAVLAVSTLVVGALAAIAYGRSRSRDPGLTTEIALLTTFLLGALAVRQPALAAGLAVAVAVLLAARTRLHRFVRRVLTEQELHDGLLFAAAALVVLPLTPDRPVGPLSVLNPRTLWKLAVLVMGISASGYVALRLLPPRLGLPLSGLASGFVSSAATIGAMGQRAAKEPKHSRAVVAGAVLSTVATVVQMVAVLAATSRPTLEALKLPLLFAGAAAAAYGLAFALRVRRGPADGASPFGRAFDLKASVLFAATVSGVLLLSAAVNQWLGAGGLLVAVALAGFADAHAAAISAASLVAAGKLPAAGAVLPILAGLTTNTLTKA
ncbi:MAG: MgtC/SapB family protein, partial [Thermoanaerobaculia bacterium]